MKVAILGSGGIGLASAAWLAHHGHEPVLWSPSGAGTRELAAGESLRYSGKIEGECRPQVATSAAEAVADADVILVAVPGNGHRTVMEAAAPHIRPGQVVIISSLCSLSALYLSRLLAGRGVEVPIATWGTTVLTARRRSGTEVAIMTVRTSLHVATLPVSQAAVGLETCRTLFGDRFIEQSDVLATSLININPVAHFGLALCNLTRIERGENWPQYHYMTDAVSRLITTLDHERLAVASAFGLKIHPIEEHFHRSFDVPVGDLADIARTIHARRGGPPGPTTLDTRFVHEDVPYGLVFAEAIGKIAGVDTTVHSAGIKVISAIYGRDFRAENDLLPVLGLEGLSKEELLRRAREGWPAATA